MRSNCMNSDSQRRISLVNSVNMYNSYNKRREELTFEHIPEQSSGWRGRT